MSPEIIDALEVGDELFTTFEVQDDKHPVVITKVYKSYGKVHGIQIEYTGFCGKCGCANGMYHKKLYIPRDELLHRLEDGDSDPTIPDHYYYRDVCVMREGCALPDVLKRREKEKEKAQHCDNKAKAEIVKPYLKMLKEKLVKRKPPYNPPQISYDAGVFDAFEIAISEINIMISELEKGAEE